MKQRFSHWVGIVNVILYFYKLHVPPSRYENTPERRRNLFKPVITVVLWRSLVPGFTLAFFGEIERLTAQLRQRRIK